MSAMSLEQAAAWAMQAAPDRIARAIREHEVWVAVEGAVIGRVEIERDRVVALYVSPACAGHGVGLALLAQAESSIQRSGYAVARLEAGPNALAFYLGRGYYHCSPPDADGAYPLRKKLAVAGPHQPTEPVR